jgi:hypothetical protein
VPRRAKRRRVLLPCERWRAVRDGCGAWVIVDECGVQPLRADDPLARLGNVYLAAAAPELRHTLLRLAHRMGTLIEFLSSQPHRDGKLLQEAYGVIALSHPPLQEWSAAEDAARRRQRELDFEVA